MADLKTATAEYHMEAPLAETELDIQVRFVRITGSAAQYFPALIAASQEGDKEGASIELITAFITVLKSSQPDEIKTFIRDVIGLVEIKRPAGFSRCNLNGDFTGKMGEMYKVLAWATGEILSDFFTELLGLGPRKPPPVT